MINFLQEVKGTWRHSWITTYSFDVSGFEDHLLHRVGDRAIDVTVLADLERLTTTWESFRASSQVDRLRWVGRRYLVRPAAARLRFHPKTYFFGGEKRGLLLVGSGNLGLQGLMSSGEVFSRFDSSTDVGLAAIRAWRQWMTVVDITDDAVVRDRWAQLLQGCLPWLHGTGGDGPFVNNSIMSLAGQLCVRSGAVQELLISTPFFDEHAIALKRLVDSLKPGKVELWIGEDASVNGPSLLNVLRSAGCPVVVWRWRGGYVHAKLVGVIGTPSLLLAGSCNMTLAGLWSTATTGNTEAGVIIEAAPQAIRALFAAAPGPDLDAVPVDLESLPDLSYARDKVGPVTAPRILLASAVRQVDGRLALRVRGDAPTAGVSARPATIESGDLDFDLIEADQWISQEVVPVEGRLVALVAEGNLLSNWAVIDDVTELRAAGAEADRGQGPIDGLSEAELHTEVGQLLRILRSSCNFDYAWNYHRLVRTARLGVATVDEEGSNPDEDIDIESIGIRPQRLRRSLAARDSTPFADLEAALAAVPRFNELRTIATLHMTAEEPGVAGPSWSNEAKLGVRLYNVLERWCEAIRLPEAMYDEYQETRNFAGLVIVLETVRSEQRYATLLGRDRIVRLVDTLFRGFVGSERAPGFLLQLPGPLRMGVVAALEQREIPALAGDLVAGAIERTRGGLRERLVMFRSWLAAAVEAGIVRGSDRRTEDDVVWAASWADDATWAEDENRRLGLDVEVVRGHGTGFATELRIRDLDLVHDPRAVRLVASYLRFSVDTKFTLVAFQGESEQLLGVELGEKLGFRNGLGWDESDQPVSRTDVFELAHSGKTWSALFTSPRFRSLTEGPKMQPA